MFTDWNIAIELLVFSVPLFVGLLVANQTYLHFIRMRAFSYIERFNSKDFMDLRITAERWLTENHSPGHLMEMADTVKPEEISTYIQIRTFLNLFQELAVSYERRLVDRSIFYKNFDYLIVSYWERFEDFIMYSRAKSGDYTMYKRFENMTKDVKKNRGKETRSSRLFAFGYGSLMIPESIHNTLNRPDENYPTFHAKLNGYLRQWDIKVPVHLKNSGKQVNALFLNIVKHANSTTNGVLLEIKPEELALLRAREINYDCLEVTHRIESDCLQPGDAVVTFIGQEEHRLQSGETAVVMSRYLAIMDTLDNHYNPIFINEYKETTIPYSCPVIDEPYVFDSEATL